jgi:hypothetical protein
MAFTSPTTYNINSHIIYTILGINITNYPHINLGSYIPTLWRNKTIMVINKISIVSQNMLSTINQHYNQICVI